MRRMAKCYLMLGDDFSAEPAKTLYAAPSFEEWEEGLCPSVGALKRPVGGSGLAQHEHFNGAFLKPVADGFAAGGDALGV